MTMAEEIPEEIRPEFEQFKAEVQAIVDENKRLKEEAPKVAKDATISGVRSVIDAFRNIISNA
jgi:hypothetical protein